MNLNNLTNRQQMILLILISADRPQTSLSIANRLSVSSRTVKSEMIQIEDVLKQNGARLIAKRNSGYSIEVASEERFADLREQLRSKSAHINLMNSKEGELFLYLTRKLVAGSQWITETRLCNEFYISPFQLNSLMKKISLFFESFRLNLLSSTKGVKISGSEQMIRVAMTELTELRSADSGNAAQDEQFEMWTGCSFQERQDIRHCFLRILRRSGYAVRDSASHRIAMYLIIARNRYQAGHRIEHLCNNDGQLEDTGVYRLAEEIVSELRKRFSGFDLDQTEILFIEALILSNLDVTLDENYQKAAPYLNEEITRAADEARKALYEYARITIEPESRADRTLKQMLLPIAAGKRYELDGYEHYDFSSDRTYQKDPLCMHVSWIVCRAVAKTLDCRFSLFDNTALACWFMGILTEERYPIKKLRILTTHSVAGAFAKTQTEALKELYSSFIETISPVELYEIRDLPENYYDVVLAENVEPGKYGKGLFGYNYDYPACRIKMVDNGTDFRTIYNEVLSLAYQTDTLIPELSSVHIYHEYEYFSEKQTYQLFAERYGSKPDKKKRLYRFMSEQKNENLLISNETAFVFGCSECCKDGYLDLYYLTKPGKWYGSSIRRILFVSWPDDASMIRLKTEAAVLNRFASDPNMAEDFSADPEQAMKKALRESVSVT